MTEADARQFLKTLTIVRDERLEIRLAHRRGQFKAGWARRAAGRPISADTLRKRLTWHNLGHRAERAGLSGKPDDLFAVFWAVYEADGPIG